MQGKILRRLTISVFVLTTSGPASAQQFPAVEIVTRAKEAVVVVVSCVNTTARETAQLPPKG